MRANWQRYDSGGEAKLTFEEGVWTVMYLTQGSLHHNVEQTLSKVRSTMCNCGALSIPELREKARLTARAPPQRSPKEARMTYCSKTEEVISVRSNESRSFYGFKHKRHA